MTFAVDILNLLKARLAAMVLDSADEGSAKIFERVELYPLKNLQEALRALSLAEERICLIIPMGVRRLRDDDSGSAGVAYRRMLDVSLLYADSGIDAAEVVFGGSANPGLLRISDLVEEQLCEAGDLGSTGGPVFGDGGSFVLSDGESGGGREAYEQDLLIPAGVTIASY